MKQTANIPSCSECENRDVGGGHLRGCINHPDPQSRRLGWNLMGACLICGSLNCHLSHAEPEPLAQGSWELGHG